MGSALDELAAAAHTDAGELATLERTFADLL